MRGLIIYRPWAILAAVAIAAGAVAAAFAAEGPPACPKCGSDENVIPIVYGYPSEELFEAAERGEVALGG
ncbi:MAG: hypothetical protein JSU81_04330 [Candidatus Coatesbacteria bacterium]|nr:MAG: hypothetical protein JSU81_04330 [Candidatus Coatesbacteria bacterium]